MAADHKRSSGFQDWDKYRFAQFFFGISIIFFAGLLIGQAFDSSKLGMGISLLVVGLVVMAKA